MDAKPKFPYTTDFAEIRKLVYDAKNHPDIRYGQGVTNMYQISYELECIIYQDNDLESVTAKIYYHYRRPDYQN